MELDLHVIFFLVRRYAVTPSAQAPSRSTGVETVQIKELESPPLLPTLEALDAEFGCENEECADAPRTERGASMNGRFKPTQVEFPTHLTAGSPTGDAIDAASHHPAALQPSLGRRVLRKLGRLLVIFCLGVCSTLAWQSYGDTARAMIAKSSPQLGWVAPQPVSVVPPAAQETAPASAASPELQQLAFALAALRQNVDLLTTQIAAGQQQMAGEIAKLRTDEQEILRKVSAAASRPPAQKPIAAGPSAPAPASSQAR
jgi:hypothetical protein